MFKYGSFKLFILKFSIGVFGCFISIIYFGSLATYNENDPGFNKFSQLPDNEVNNFFGIIGSYLSSYSLIFFGYFAYLIAVFIFIESARCLFGVINKFVFLRLLCLFIGSIFIDTFIINYGPAIFFNGLFSIFFSNLIFDYFSIKLELGQIIYLVYFILLIAGFLLVFFSL